MTKLVKKVAMQFEEQAKWFKQIEEYEEPHYKILYVQTDPKPLLNGIPESSAGLLETRETRIFEANEYKGTGQKYLVRYKVDDDGYRFIKPLMDREKRVILNKQKHLRISEEEFKGVHYHTRINKSYKDRAQKIRGEFEGTLDEYKFLTIEYAVERTYICEVKDLVSKGELDKAIELLRPHSYPLIKFAHLPQFYGNHRICDFKDQILYLIETLVEGYKENSDEAENKIGYLYEAFAIVYLVNPDSTFPEYLKLAEELADLLESTGKPKDMARAKYLREHYLEVEE